MSNYQQQIENTECDENMSGHWKLGQVGAISAASRIAEFADAEISKLEAKLVESERLREQTETKFSELVLQYERNEALLTRYRSDAANEEVSDAETNPKT